MSVFSEKAISVINDYRQLLKKFMTRTERAEKLVELQLNNRLPTEPDLDLHRTTQHIAHDVKIRLDGSANGYYSYSGFYSFYEHVMSILNEYTIIGARLMHKTQAASCALLEAVQLLSTSPEKYDDKTYDRFHHCNSLLSRFASDEQLIRYREYLEQRLYQNEPFFTKVIDDLQSCLEVAEESHT